MTGEHHDEKIRYIINQVEEQAEANSQNIYEGITIDGKHYEFREMSFFENLLKIQIPTTFIDMPEHAAKIKYLSDHRADVIKTDQTGGINITLKMIPNNVEDQYIPQVKNVMKTLMQRLNPSYLFLDDGEEKIAGKTIGFFEFKSPALDTAVFHRMFFVEIKSNVVLGVFNCPYDNHPEWQPIARQIMQSVRIAEPETQTVEPEARAGRRT